MESTNRTSIEKPSWTEVSFSSIGLLVFYHISRVTPYPFPTFCAYHDVSFELPCGNGRDSGITEWENMGMGFKFQMGMGIKSLKWEGIGTKNLFPHTSTLYSSSLRWPASGLRRPRCDVGLERPRSGTCWVIPSWRDRSTPDWLDITRSTSRAGHGWNTAQRSVAFKNSH